MKRTRHYLAGCLAIAALVGCTSNADAGDLNLGSVAPSTPTTTAPSVEQPTSVPATDEPTTTTQPPVVTEAPTTTAAASVEDQVRADYEAAHGARQQCAYEPLGCDYAAIAIPGSPMDTQTRDVTKTRIDSNLRAVEGHGDVQVRIESVDVQQDRAFVTICAYDTVVIYDIADPANPDDDIIFNDQSVSYRVRWDMRPDGGRWRLYAGDTLEQRFDGDLCGF